MKKEIVCPEDVQLLVRTFYSRVLLDSRLAPFFAHVVKDHWEKHLEVLDLFWNNILFYSGGYDGNPLQAHKTLHQFKTLHTQDFDRWLQLFNETVDELFEGEKAELAKQRAHSIASVMQLKILPDEAPSNGNVY